MCPDHGWLVMVSLRGQFQLTFKLWDRLVRGCWKILSPTMTLVLCQDYHDTTYPSSHRGSGLSEVLVLYTSFFFWQRFETKLGTFLSQLMNSLFVTAKEAVVSLSWSLTVFYDKSLFKMAQGISEGYVGTQYSIVPHLYLCI